MVIMEYMSFPSVTVERMIPNSEAVSYGKHRAWWQMGRDGCEQMDPGVAHVSHTGLHWDRALGIVPCQQEQPAMSTCSNHQQTPK